MMSPNPTVKSKEMLMAVRLLDVELAVHLAVAVAAVREASQPSSSAASSRRYAPKRPRAKGRSAADASAVFPRRARHSARLYVASGTNAPAG
jgi:hypothetical protein